MHVEEKEFNLRLELRCSFPDDYEGDEDGYVWTEQARPLLAAAITAAMQALGRHPAWKVRPGNRGRSSDDEVTLILEKVIAPDPR